MIQKVSGGLSTILRLATPSVPGVRLFHDAIMGFWMHRPRLPGSTLEWSS